MLGNKFGYERNILFPIKEFKKQIEEELTPYISNDSYKHKLVLIESKQYKIHYSDYEINDIIRDIKNHIDLKRIKIKKVDGDLLQFRIKYSKLEIYLYERND